MRLPARDDPMILDHQVRCGTNTRRTVRFVRESPRLPYLPALDGPTSKIPPDLGRHSLLRQQSHEVRFENRQCCNATIMSCPRQHVFPKYKANGITPGGPTCCCITPCHSAQQASNELPASRLSAIARAGPQLSPELILGEVTDRAAETVRLCGSRPAARHRFLPPA